MPSEPVVLVGEGEYNLNVLTDIKVTESYLGLDENIRKCQNEEPFDNCTTRQYRNTFLGDCGCLPLNIRLFNEVLILQMSKILENVHQIFFRTFFAPLQQRWTV